MRFDPRFFLDYEIELSLFFFAPGEGRSFFERGGAMIDSCYKKVLALHFRHVGFF